MSSVQHHDEYSDEFIAALQWIWGRGFLSPGGASEVAEVLSGVVIEGKHVLDIGFGVGGIDVLLVKEFGAAKVTAIDVAQPLQKHARQNAADAGVADQIDFQIVKAGPLPFVANSFDIVFSKDSMIHIPDKHAIYQEIYRVLKPGGQLAVSDWLGSDQPHSDLMQEWLTQVGLRFELVTLQEIQDIVATTGCENIKTRDRNRWYCDEILNEIAMMQGQNFDKLARLVGQAAAEQRLRSSSIKQKALESGELRPGHIQASKPV